MDTSAVLSVPQPVLMGLVLLLGLLGTVVPGVPGPLVVWAGVFWWAVWDQSNAAWLLLTGVTGLLLVTAVARLFIPVHGYRGAETARRTLLVAGAAGTVGFVALPVIGVVPGFVGGIYGRERVRLGGHGAAVASTRAAMRAGGWRVLTDLAACLVATGAWFATVLWG
ncbi:DUF456 domain-containing protein [Streptomyces iconiensis]|uniref:DUF456 domain-containing protein n=1 Tax=Streptomyces iconiensis TaxID=1384038 RepID=A0ABT7A6F2_9ACTN|nr:DUF456 domain-containing protein [Streptomyces iconiensis]MDJ1136925.1 DUF456 domain-containing protein [Streptomyces iconiensis]